METVTRQETTGTTQILKSVVERINNECKFLPKDIIAFKVENFPKIEFDFRSPQLSSVEYRVGIDRAIKASEAVRQNLQMPSKQQLACIEEVMVRFRAACADPENPKSKYWLDFADCAAQQFHPHLKLLPDPQCNKGGRPRERSKRYKVLISSAMRCIEDGASLNEAAKAAVRDSRQKCGTKNTLKYLKDLLRKELAIE